MRYRLHTLLIAVVLGPSLVAYFWVIGGEVIPESLRRFSRTPYWYWQALVAELGLPLFVLAVGAAFAYLWHVAHREPAAK